MSAVDNVVTALGSGTTAPAAGGGNSNKDNDNIIMVDFLSGTGGSSLNPKTTTTSSLSTVSTATTAGGGVTDFLQKNNTPTAPTVSDATANAKSTNIITPTKAAATPTPTSTNVTSNSSTMMKSNNDINNKNLHTPPPSPMIRPPFGSSLNKESISPAVSSSTKESLSPYRLSKDVPAFRLNSESAGPPGPPAPPGASSYRANTTAPSSPFPPNTRKPRSPFRSHKNMELAVSSEHTTRRHSLISMPNKCSDDIDSNNKYIIDSDNSISPVQRSYSGSSSQDSTLMKSSARAPVVGPHVNTRSSLIGFDPLLKNDDDDDTSDLGSFSDRASLNALSAHNALHAHSGAKTGLNSRSSDTTRAVSANTALNAASAHTVLNTVSTHTVLNAASTHAALNAPSAHTALNAPSAHTALNALPSAHTALNALSSAHTALNALSAHTALSGLPTVSGHSFAVSSEDELCRTPTKEDKDGQARTRQPLMNQQQLTLPRDLSLSPPPSPFSKSNKISEEGGQQGTCLEEQNFRLTELRKIAKELGTPQRQAQTQPPTKEKAKKKKDKKEKKHISPPRERKGMAAAPRTPDPTTPSSLVSPTYKKDNTRTPTGSSGGRKLPWKRRGRRASGSNKSTDHEILSEVQIQNMTAAGENQDANAHSSTMESLAADLLMQPQLQPQQHQQQQQQQQQKQQQKKPQLQQQQKPQQLQQNQLQQQDALLPTSPMMQDLYQVMTQQETEKHKLTIPSLAKPSPTSFLTGTEVVRSSETDPSLFQMEIPELQEFIVNSRLCQFLEEYRKEDLNMDLQTSLVGIPRMQLQSFVANGIVPPSSATLVNAHTPIVESLLECSDDVTLEAFFEQTSATGGKTVDDRREVAMFERQRQFIVVFRGTTAQQQGKVFKNKKSSNATVPLDVGDQSIQVFSSFKESYIDLETRLFQCLDQLTEQNPFCDVVFSGHSFGGAMATLAAYRYATARSVVRVSCHVFGSPKVGTREFRSSANSLPNLKVMRVEYGNDPKCSLPSDGCHIGHSLFILNKTSINAYRFDEGTARKENQKKFGFKKERDISAYVTALEEFEKRGGPWVEGYVGEDVGDGVLGKDNEERQMV